MILSFIIFLVGLGTIAKWCDKKLKQFIEYRKEVKRLKKIAEKLTI